MRLNIQVEKPTGDPLASARKQDHSQSPCHLPSVSEACSAGAPYPRRGREALSHALDCPAMPARPLCPPPPTPLPCGVSGLGLRLKIYFRVQGLRFRVEDFSVFRPPSPPLPPPLPPPPPPPSPVAWLGVGLGLVGGRPREFRGGRGAGRGSANQKPRSLIGSCVERCLRGATRRRTRPVELLTRGTAS